MTNQFLFKQVTDEADATHRTTKIYYEDVFRIEKIQRPKVIDLSGLVGNDQILFEFNDPSGSRWSEGYLIDTCPNRGFLRAAKYSQKVKTLTNNGWFKLIRFQTDRWYAHDGKTYNPLPRGVAYETIVVDNGESDEDKRIRPVPTPLNGLNWIHETGYLKVIAYRITGLLPNCVMPGGE